MKRWIWVTKGQTQAGFVVKATSRNDAFRQVSRRFSPRRGAILGRAHPID